MINNKIIILFIITILFIALYLLHYFTFNIEYSTSNIEYFDNNTENIHKNISLSSSKMEPDYNNLLNDGYIKIMQKHNDTYFNIDENKYINNNPKPWQKTPVSYNDEHYDKIPHSDIFITIDDKISSQLINSKDKIDFFKKMITPNIHNIIKNIPSFNIDEISQNKINELNNDTWINRTELYDPNTEYVLETIKSPIKEVNSILSYILDKINNALKNELSIHNKLKVSYIDPYYIYKYKILKIKKNKNNDITYDFILVIIKSINTLVTTIWCNIIKMSNGNIYITDIYIIGVYSTDQLFSYTGVDTLEDNKYLFINKPKQTSYKIIENEDTINRILNKYKTDKLSSKKYPYGCFLTDIVLYNNHTNTNEQSNADNILDTNDNSNVARSRYIRADSREQCENKVDIYNRWKQRGIWDRPCINNEECMFYKSNTNYKNEFGKCTNGFCELPLNMINVGYRYYLPNNEYKPLCYNCNSNSFSLNSGLGSCCDEQWDKVKYPFLDSPDYAFKNDAEIRLNAYSKK